jgi:tetratricopeptide (TPR) repeat protein
MSASQSSSVTGSHNIVVQAQGDGITVNLSQPHLSLVAWHRQQRKPEKTLDLLNPFVRAIPLVGRESAIAELESWLASNLPISVRCLIGSGGSGKTRLGIELCESAEHGNWLAGFVTHNELTRFAGQQNLSNWGWSKDTLVIVDYAAARARGLREWLLELAQNQPSTGKRLRLLLLERHADPKLGWWHDLVTPGTFSEEFIGALFDPVVPMHVPSIANIDQRRDILACVMAEASRLLRKPHVLKPPAPEENAEFDRKLADPSIASAPLYLTMSGVTAAQQGIPTLLMRGGAEMAQRIASDELSRIGKMAADRNVNADLLKYLAVAVTLAGGYPRDELVDCIAEERAALGYGQQDDQSVADAACDVLGVQLDLLSPILPDLIGEAAILEQITKLPKQKQKQFVTRWFARVRGPVAATLVRTTQDYTATDDPLRWFDDVVDADEDFQSLVEIYDQIPQQTLRLRDCALRVSELLVSRVKDGSATSGDHGTRNPILALALTALSIRLGDLGRREEALVCAKESVDIRRELAATEPDTFRPQLAFSLNNLALRLRDCGRREEALTQAQESVGILRDLAAAQPGAFRANLAISLNTLANRLGAVGRREDALAPIQESVELYSELAAAQPNAFQPCMAMSLDSLANTLSELGRREEALVPARESMELYRELAAANPDSFQPGMALSLNNLANRLNDVRQWKEALIWAQEAVDIRRQLAEAQPDAFLPFLATSLMNLGNVLMKLEHRQQALEREQEAVELCRKLTVSQPDVFRSQLAMSLLNLAATLSAMGRREDAFATAEESVKLYRELVAGQPNAFSPYLARSLNVLSDCLESMSMLDAAVRTDEEAADTLGPMFSSTPVAFVELMAAIVSAYGRRLKALNRQPRPDLVDLPTRVLTILNREGSTQPPAQQ